MARPTARAGRGLGAGAVVAFGAAVVAGSGLFGATGATAATGCGSLPAGNAVYVDCVVPAASAPYTSYSDGQQVDLAMGRNDVLSGALAGRDIVVVECEYTTGNGPGDPPNPNFCDAQTLAAGFPYTVHVDGSFDYRVDERGGSVLVFALPDATLPGATISCDSTHPCVWYVGEDYNDFTKPHVWSNPFVVTGGSTPISGAGPTSGAAPLSPTTTLVAGENGLGTSRSPAGGTSASAGGQLAYTGQPPLVAWIGGTGVVLLLCGRVARWRLNRGSW